MNAARILSEKGTAVVSVRPEVSLVEAAQALADNGVGAVVVLDGANRPIGVFSERDLARCVAEQGAAALDGLVADAMSTTLVTAPETETIDALMQTMTEHRVRHVLIMNTASLQGVVSIGDVVKRKIANAEAEAESLKAYIEGV